MVEKIAAKPLSQEQMIQQVDLRERHERAILAKKFTEMLAGSEAKQQNEVAKQKLINETLMQRLERLEARDQYFAAFEKNVIVLQDKVATLQTNNEKLASKV